MAKRTSQEIESILDDGFGQHSTERVEDLLEEREKLISYCYCGKEQDEKFKPYCSEKCQTEDNLLC